MDSEQGDLSVIGDQRLAQHISFPLEAIHSQQKDTFAVLANITASQCSCTLLLCCPFPPIQRFCLCVSI